MAEAGVGYSLVKGYNVPPIMFTEEEAAALFTSRELIDLFGDESLKQTLSSALLKIRAVLPENHKNYLNRLGGTMEVWSRPNAEPDEKLLIPVQKAVVRKKCLSIVYDAGDMGTLTERVIEPLGLLLYSRRWHLIAWCRLRKAMRDFRLDRLAKWSMLDESFTGHEDFSLSKYMDSIDEEHANIPIEIVCDSWVLERVVQEMPCQIVSRKKLPDNQYLISANAYWLQWVAKWIIGMSGSVIAQHPPELREQVASEAEKIMSIHKELHKTETLLT